MSVKEAPSYQTITYFSCHIGGTEGGCYFADLGATPEMISYLRFRCLTESKSKLF